MPETPVAAAPAAPAAAPVAPVVAAVAPVAAPVVAPVTASPEAPVAPVVAALPAGDSLLDSAKPAAVAPVMDLAAAQAMVEAARLAAQPNSGKAWNLTDTTPGAGEKPAWFKNDKYVSVAKQAEAYVELEKRFGGFVGAPKDDKGAVAYKPTLPEGVAVDINHPVMQEFVKTAGELNMSQPAFDKMLGMLASYEASQAPNPTNAKAKLGPNADTRISSVASWARANLDETGYQLMRTVTAGHEMAPAFMLLEKMIAKTNQPSMPKPGADNAPAAAQGKQALDEMQAKKGPDGKRLYETSPDYRRQVEAARTEYFKANPVVRDRQGNVRG